MSEQYKGPATSAPVSLQSAPIFVEHEGVSYLVCAGIKTEYSGEWEDEINCFGERELAGSPRMTSATLRGVTWRSDNGWQRRENVQINTPFRVTVPATQGVHP